LGNRRFSRARRQESFVKYLTTFSNSRFERATADLSIPTSKIPVVAGRSVIADPPVD
jgi:hypothetical protein